MHAHGTHRLHCDCISQPSESHLLQRVPTLHSQSSAQLREWVTHVADVEVDCARPDLEVLIVRKPESKAESTLGSEPKGCQDYNAATSLL